jgi:hypothetical protein
MHHRVELPDLCLSVIELHEPKLWMEYYAIFMLQSCTTCIATTVFNLQS